VLGLFHAVQVFRLLFHAVPFRSIARSTRPPPATS
jgi:hypothetical protein